MAQLVVGGAAVSDVVFHAGLGYLLIVLAAHGRGELESLQPDVAALRTLLPTDSPVFGIVVTCAAGGAAVQTGASQCFRTLIAFCLESSSYLVARVAWLQGGLLSRSVARCMIKRSGLARRC